MKQHRFATISSLNLVEIETLVNLWLDKHPDVEIVKRSMISTSHSFVVSIWYDEEVLKNDS
jgi:hypothetical protein